MAAAGGMQVVNMRVVGMMMMMMVVVVAVVSAEGACPSTGQLSQACSQYVLGQNPPVPPASGGCCKLLQGSSSSCLCSSIPASARSIISKKGLNQVRSSCKLPYSCPGF